MEQVNWNQFSTYYNKISKLEREYTINQINCINVTSGDTVLDVRCGPGRIAIPIAKRAKSVTALDAFEDMLIICRENAVAEGVNNLNTKLLDWKDAVINETIDKHDIVIASRSLGMVEPEKLNAAANKMVVMIGWVKDESTSIGSLFSGILDDNANSFSASDDPVRNYISGYQIAFNEVYDMGALPNVRVVKDGFKRNYSSREEAYKDLSDLREFQLDKMNIFKENVDKFLETEKDGSITYRCERWSYVLWWNAV